MNAHSKITSSQQLLATASLSSGAAVRAPRPLQAQNDGGRIVQTMLSGAANAKITVLSIRRNISVLDGSGGNPTVFTGKDGKVLMDAGYTASKPRITIALDSLGPEPIKRLINTHWHADHTDGNAWLHQTGSEIMAHEKTWKRLSVPTRVEGWTHTFPAAPFDAMPASVFPDRHQLHGNDTNIILTYCGPAHTDSDIAVNFTEADVSHVGDAWWKGIYPLIDYSTGGSIESALLKQFTFREPRCWRGDTHGSDSRESTKGRLPSLASGLAMRRWHAVGDGRARDGSL